MFDNGVSLHVQLHMPNTSQQNTQVYASSSWKHSRQGEDSTKKS